MSAGFIEPASFTEPDLDAPDDDSDRTAHWGHCEDDDCGTTIVIYPHPDNERDLPDRDDWDDSHISCPVCGDCIMWGGSDPARTIIRNY